MGFLRADGPVLPMRPTRPVRFVIARRGLSIGTLLFRSQCKRALRLGFALALGLSCAAPTPVRAAEPAAPPTASALPPPPRAATPPAAATPAAAPPVAGEPLPPPPPPRFTPIPPAAAAAV